MLVSEEFGSPQDEINSKNPQYNIMAVRTRYVNGVKEIRKFMAKNIVTEEGNKYYAKLGSKETPSIDFDDADSRMILQNPSAADTPLNTNNLSNVTTQLALSNRIIEDLFPETGNTDTNNPQSSPDTSITRKYVWGTVDFNTEGQIESFGTVTPGTGYAEILVEGDVGGTGEIIVITTSSGVLDTIDIIDPGKGFTAGNFTLSGTGFNSGTAAYTVDSFGRIITATITNSGSGNDSPVVTVPAGGGATTIATSVATADSSGFITAVYVTFGGVGYTADPTISITNDVTGGASGTAVAVISAVFDITGGAIHDDGSFPSPSTELLTHFNFGSSFEKLSTDELTVYINHQFLGV